MKEQIKKSLIDILQAPEEIQSFVRGMDFGAYRDSPVTQRAVERNFEIIGEALSRISQTDKEFLSNISEHHRIIAFRNILIHGYDVIDEAIVWNAVKNHLPILVRDVTKMFNT